MKLKELTIKLGRSYEENAGKYIAAMEWEGERGKVTLTLDPKVSEALLAFIGPALTEFSHQAALQIEQSVAQSVLEARRAPAIEALSSAT